MPLDREIAAHGLSMKPMNTFAAGAHIQAKIASLPLKEMEASLLRTAILSHIAHSYRLDIDGEYILAQVETAIDIASYAHRSQTRQNRGEMPKVHYVEHPLRNALRALRYGVTSDPATIIAIILHDVVEDCAAIVAVELCDAPLGLGEETYRRIVHFYFLRTFGAQVVRIVGALTNPLSPDGLTRDEKNTRYVEHVLAEIGDPRVFVAKYVNFVDNALSLHHSVNPAMVKRLAAKYLMLVEPFRARLADSDLRLIVPETGIQMMLDHLNGNQLEAQAA